jgi:hypothetical protein
MTYSDKLKDPRWQKCRLEILKRDGFKCQSCGDTEEELTVHHVYYEKDIDPWDYPDETYMTLCKKCHDKWHRLKYAMDRSLCHVDIDQLNHLQAIIVMLKMMGPNITLIFFDLISGYHIQQLSKDQD